MQEVKWLFLACLFSFLKLMSFEGDFKLPEASDLKNEAFYLGSGFYLGNFLEDEGFGSLSPFVGNKGAFLWQQSKNTLLSSEPVLGSTFNKKAQSRSGFHVGLDWSLNEQFGFLFTAEAAAIQARETSFLDAERKDSKRVVSFPITFGFRCLF